MRMSSNAGSGFRPRCALLVCVLMACWSGIQLASAQTSVSPSAPAPAVQSRTAEKLTPELLAKMLHGMSVMGRDAEVPPKFASALGLTATGTAWPGRTLAVVNPEDDSHRAINVGRGTEQDIVLSVFRNGFLHCYRVQRDGTLVSALVLEKASQKLTMRTPAEAQADLDAEIAYWAANIDALVKP